MNKLLTAERSNFIRATAALLVTSFLNLSTPAILAYAIDTYLAAGDYQGVLRCGALLLLIFLVAFVTQYFQSLWMGSIGQRIVYRLRDQVFHKLQGLPLAYFAQHQTGDLISRINHDTDKLNQFFSQSLMRFLGSIVTMTGSALFLIGLNPRLGAAALLPAVAIAVITWALTPWIKSRNSTNLVSVGKVSAEVAESLENFKVITVFDRRDYFRESFARVNAKNYDQSIRAGIANGVLGPLFALCSQAAQLIVLVYGLILTGRGQFSLGLLIGFLVYVNRVYDPMRQLAALWATFQSARAGYARITEILRETSELPILPTSTPEANAPRLEFRQVSFGYRPGQTVLHQVSFKLEAGKSYAFVGPTGGGKTTTASVMARLFDPTEGEVLLDGRDLRTFSPEERSQTIGFILQEPFLFSGTLGDNLQSLEGLEEMFEQGLDTPVDGLSLGQRQVVAFLRAVERKPALLILDEATANIDTVTEKTLERLLQNLPEETTRVVIAHRFGTIENADQIFFVNSGYVEETGSIHHAVSRLKEEQRKS
jgi:ABC-type multidrug transport system fused ATPase/permease subunit